MQLPEDENSSAVPRAIPIAGVDAQRAMPFAHAVSARLAPTGETERIATIDALRGFALFGILIVNITFFADGAPISLETAGHAGDTIDNVAYFISRVFGNYKFVTLFSVLFGMGLALQSNRAGRRERPFAPLYARRLGVLFGFGVLHGIVLWYGDILTMYATLGFIAMLFRHARQRTLIITASILVAVPLLLMPRLIALNQMSAKIPVAEIQAPIESMPSDPIAADDDCPTPSAFTDTPTPTNSQPPITIDRLSLEFATIEVELYGRGPFYLSMLHRGIYYVILNIYVGVFLLGWRCLAMFLVGMAIIRSGLMTRLADCRQRLIRWVLIATPIGFGVELFGEFVSWKFEPSYWPMLISESAMYTGSIGVAIGYFGLICLISLSDRGRRLLTPLAATGRMALTNYIGQSILCGLVFYSYGFGMIGRIRFSLVLLIAAGIFALQVVSSAIWLRYFRFGPLEWLWRSLAYLTLQPMRRGNPAMEPPA